MIVAGEHGDAGARLPVPDADRLVVGAAQDPRVLVMELGRAHIVQVAEQGEDATTLLVIPHLDLEIVSAGNEQGLLAVEGDAPHWSIVFIELLQECVHSVVPQLDHAIV